MPSFQFFEQVVLKLIQKFYAAHLHHRHRPVFFTVISFNIFFTADARNVPKKTLQFETMKQEI